MQAVHEQKIEYRSPAAYGIKEDGYVLFFPLGEAILERAEMGTLRLRRGEAVLLPEAGKYVFRAEDAIIITFTAGELRELPLTDGDRASMFSILKIENNPETSMLYFRDLRENFIIRAFDLVEECAERKYFFKPVLAMELGSLLLRLTRYIWRTVVVREESDSERTRKMLNYMLQHYGTVSLEELAAEFNYHPNTAAALLKKSTGRTFSELLLGIRMSRVAEALRAGRTVSEAAADCGYSNMSNFYRRFKQYYGKTPAAYLKGGERTTC